jgi:hypothetical protein
MQNQISLSGPGIHIDYYTKIKDIRLDTAQKHITSHYAYSKVYDFDPEKICSGGASLNLVYDSRDNMINTYKGMYANINYRINKEFLGSDQNSATLWTEFRTYLSMDKKVPEKVLAFWYVGHFLTDGAVPYLNLPAIGNDQRGKTGRGYVIARYRGQDLMYGEVEYRFPLSKCTKHLERDFCKCGNYHKQERPCEAF